MKNLKIKKFIALVMSAVMLCAALSGCSVIDTFSAIFESYAADFSSYGSESGWAIYSEGMDKRADVFMVAPTVYSANGDSLNMSLEDEATKASFLGALNMQKGIFSDECRVFAPYYRQAAIEVYTLSKNEREEYLELAYGDISKAFSYYLNHCNNGKPIILGGFSQGADMCIRLLKDHFGRNNSNLSKIVTVYAIGWQITDEDLSEIQGITLAKNAYDSASIVSFECEAEDVTDSLVVPQGETMYSINPLTWDCALGVKADKTLNKGACFTNSNGEIVTKINYMTGAYIDPVRGTLKVTDVDKSQYKSNSSLFGDGEYHIYDYMFFYNNLKENVTDRLNRYINCNNIYNRSNKSVYKEIQALYDEEDTLLSQYDTLAYEDSITLDYNGKAYTKVEILDLLNNAETDREFDELYDLYVDIQSQYSKEYYDIYKKLITNRNLQAQLYGFDNYAEYAQSEYFERDFSLTTQEILYDNLKDYYVNQFDDWYFDYFSDLDYYLSKYDFTTKEEITERIHNSEVDLCVEYKDAIDYLLDKDNLTIEDNPSGTKFSYVETNFLGTPKMCVYSDSVYEFYYLFIHELGHYAQEYYTDDDFYNNELFEMQSTSNSLLLYPYTKELFIGDDSGLSDEDVEYLTNEMNLYLILSYLDDIIESAICSELETYAYLNADTLTYERFEEKYLKLLYEYNRLTPEYQNEYDDEYKTYWYYDSMLFTSPCYNVTYAVSGLAAMNFWYQSNFDRSSAVEKYMELLKYNRPDFGYFRIMNDLGEYTFVDGEGYSLHKTALSDEIEFLFDAVYE